MGEHVAKAVIMPALGMSQDTGRLIAWLKKEGDKVEAGEMLMEIETDKAIVQIESPTSGILSNVSAAEGDIVPVGQAIALISAPGESTIRGPKADENRESFSASSASPMVSIPAAPVQSESAGIPASLPGRRTPASPKARRLAKERGILLSELVGSGPLGAIVAVDIPEALPSVQSESKQSAERVVAPRDVSDHGTFAERVPRSQAASVEIRLRREVDATQLIFWRSEIHRHTDVKVTYTDMLIRMLASCLLRHPYLNASWRGGEMQFNSDANIGFVLPTETGAVVPVVHRANELSFSEIGRRCAELVELADKAGLTRENIEGATFTITDLGMLGVDSFDAVVLPPQVAALAVGRVAERLILVDKQVETRPVIQLTLSCDYRVIDGWRGAAFLKSLVEVIENPIKLLIYP